MTTKTSQMTWISMCFEMSVAEKVQAFFQKHPVVGLILPDGWFGRSYDNLYKFKSAKSVQEEFHIEFSGREMLRIRGDLQVDRTEQSLVLSGFSLLEWSWQFYGSDKYETRTYSTGRAELPAQPF